MTNNPDSKAPEHVNLVFGGDDVDFAATGRGFEYTRTDAITPQQAAKVLLDAHEMTDYGAFGVNFSDTDKETDAILSALIEGEKE